MLRTLSAKQFIELLAFNDLEPIGAFREDVRTASIVATLVNLHRDTKRFPDPFPISDFVLLWGDDLKNQKPSKKKEKSWQELKAMGQFLAALYNAAEEKPKGRRRKKE